jgi:hypothetical protein
MLFSLLRIGPFVALLVLLVTMRNKRRAYLLAVFLCFPLIDLRVTPVQFGGFTVFDAMTYCSLPVLLVNFKYFRTVNLYYLLLSLALLVVLGVGAVASEFTLNSLLSLVSFASIFICSNLLLQELYQGPDALSRLITGLNAVALLSLVWLGIQVALGQNVTFYPELNHNVEDPSGIRYASFFHDPQKYAQFLSMSSFLFLIQSNQDDQPRKLSQYVLFGLCVLALLLTGARSALFGLGVGFILLLSIQSTATKLGLAAGGALAGLLLYQHADSFIALERLRDIDESYDWRAEIWQGAVAIWKSHPFLGIGVGNYQQYAMAHAPYQSILLDNDEVMYLDQPENGYLKVLTEFGLPGFLLFIAIFSVPLAKAFTRFRQADACRILFVLCASLVSWVIAFNSLYSIVDKRVLLVVAAIICSIIVSTSNQPSRVAQRL